MNTLFSAVSLVALVLGALAISVAFYKTSLGKSTIELQNANIAALTLRVEEMTKELAEVKQKNLELHSRNQYLEGMVTGKQELAQLLSEVSSIRNEVSKLEGIMTQGPSQS